MPEVTYERSLPVEEAMHPGTLLAYEMNGEVSRRCIAILCVWWSRAGTGRAR